MDRKKSALEKIKTWISEVKKKVQEGMRKVLAKIRGPKGQDSEEATMELFLPESTEDLVWLLKKLPEGVLSKEERNTIGAVMTFRDKKVRDIMTPRAKVLFVYENDFMGPLTLDRLYRSGLKHFPVLDTRGAIAGVLHTASLNSLQIKETDRASSYLDKTVYYVRDNYSVAEVLAAFVRTESQFLVVVNQGGYMVGLITFADLMKTLVGEINVDDFCKDNDLMAVAKRGTGVNAQGGGF